MKTALSVNDLQNMFEYIAQKMIDNEAYLTSIDKKIGDGDHGTSMALGFREVKKELQTKDFNSVNEVFHSVGMTLLDTMGGASGVLFGTVFISGIIGLDPMKEIDLAGLTGIFERSLMALKKRGKAKIGDKTMVDAFEPATVALLDATANGLGLVDGFSQAAVKAKEGMEYTKRCIAKFGRAKSFGEASLGFADAGAVSVAIIFGAIDEWMKENYAG